MKIFIAGQEGMVGTALYKKLSKKKLNLIHCPRKYLDLTSQAEVINFFNKKKPDVVVNAAGKVGGIYDNSKYKSEYLYTNAMIGLNLLESSRLSNVKQFINLGSACIYPKFTKQPIKEKYLLSSYLEETNEGYALAKIITLKFCEYINTQKKRRFISLQPANLYGPGDNFNLSSSHVLPALIRKFYEAKKKKLKKVEVWGSGNISREFLHVDDLARAIYFVMKNKINETFVNVAGPDSISIKNLALKLKTISKFEGKLFFNQKYPDGVKKRKLCGSKLRRYGWKPKISLKDGLVEFYKYFEKNNKELI